MTDRHSWVSWSLQIPRDSDFRHIEIEYLNTSDNLCGLCQKVSNFKYSFVFVRGPYFPRELRRWKQGRRKLHT
jgi:hypothetical protein